MCGLYGAVDSSASVVTAREVGRGAVPPGAADVRAVLASGAEGSQASMVTVVVSFPAVLGRGA